MLLEASEVLQRTDDVLGVLSGKRPRLHELGIPAFDSLFGGLSPGNVGILGADTGVGKSTVMLCSARQRKGKCGIISAEDPPDVVGSRMLSYLTGISTMKMRRGTLTDKERERLRAACKEFPTLDKLAYAFDLTTGIHNIAPTVRSLAADGCDLVWFDYMQKKTGHCSTSRRMEVNLTFATFAEACYSANIAGMMVSQIRTLPEGRHRPYKWDIKESRDPVNDARLVIMAWRDRKDSGLLHLSLDKSTHGGDGARCQYRRMASGMLEPVVPNSKDPF